MGFKNFGGVALFWFHPFGGLPSPIWPSQILALGTLTKIVFVRGGSPPIWGRYEFWSVCTLAHFFSKSARQILDFSSRSLVSTACYRFREFKQIVGARFEQISLKVGKKREKSLFGVREAKIFKVPRPLQWANVKILSRWSRNGAR